MSAEAVSARTRRRQELVRIAGELFATRGVENTTVRDIGEAAGILSGSLYHHFDSKESIIEELLAPFQSELWLKYEAILASGAGTRDKVRAVIEASFRAIEDHHTEVAVFQNDAAYLMGLPGFAFLRTNNERFHDMWIELIEDGIATGDLRPDVDPELAFRFIRDTLWVAVRWYRPEGDTPIDEIAEQYIEIVLHGIQDEGDDRRSA